MSSQPSEAPARPEGPPLRCPRCSATPPRSEFRQHLWQAHRLLLVGREIREAWSVLRSRADDFVSTGNADRLGPGFDLARLLDPDHGEERFARLLTPDQLVQDALDRAAASRGASLCPRCFALVPVEGRVMVPPMNVARGRLSAAGFVAEVSERAWRPRLYLATPKAVLRNGTGDGPLLTPRGRTWIIVGPPVFAALLLAVAFTFMARDATGPVLLLLGLASAAALILRFGAKSGAGPADRAVDHAWTVLVPHLHKSTPTPEAAGFEAALASVSIGLGQPEARAQALHQSVERIERSLADSAEWLDCLPPLWRLLAEDAHRQGRDPVSLVARLLSRCLEASLPMEAGDALLHRWKRPWWTDGARGRLRVLLCDRAFEVDLEVADLVAAARHAPALADLLGSSVPSSLAQLRLLWGLRTDRPWDRCGDAFTVFEVAGQGGNLFDRVPDLLLHQAVTDWPPDQTGPLTVTVCTRGVLFQETLFTAMPTEIEVSERPGGRYELVLGPCQFDFRDDPTDLARLLERWMSFYFQEFLPRSATMLDRPRSRPVPVPLPKPMVTCPDCREPFVAVSASPAPSQE